MSGNERPSAAAILEQLDRIVSSKAFDVSDRNRRFLRYIVIETLEGRADRIKAYAIATVVFERDADFDPQADPIIRIEASRLRRALAYYYLTAGQDEPIRIAVPKGSYVPCFELAADAASARPAAASVIGTISPPPARSRPAAWRYPTWFANSLVLLALTLFVANWVGGAPPLVGTSGGEIRAERGPRLFVVPFEADNTMAEHAGLASALTREVVAGLTRFEELFVFAPETSFHYGAPDDVDALVEDLGVDYIISGGLSATPERIRVTAALVDARSRQFVWSEAFEGDISAGDLVRIQTQIADRVVQALAQPYGVIFDVTAKEIRGKPPSSLTSYECVLEYHRYYQRMQATLIPEMRTCLVRAIRADPDYADAWATLALVYADAYRFKFDAGLPPDSLLPRALELAQRAIDLAPAAARGYQALHVVYWFMHDVERSFQAAEKALALNPNHAGLLADLGLRRCMRGDWARGLPLLKAAFARNPAQPSAYRYMFFLDHYINGQYAEALAEAERIDAPGVIYTPVTLAMAYGQLGRREEAAAAIRQILALDPDYGEHIVADLGMRNLHPDLIRVIVDGLRYAGLEVADDPDIRAGPARRVDF